MSLPKEGYGIYHFYLLIRKEKMKKVNHGQTHFFTCDSKDKTIELRAQNDEKLLLIGSIKFPLTDTIRVPENVYALGDPIPLQYTLNADPLFCQGDGVWLNKDIASPNDPLLVVSASVKGGGYTSGQSRGSFLVYHQDTNITPFEQINVPGRTNDDSSPPLVLRASISGNTATLTFREERGSDLAHRMRKFEFRSEPTFGLYNIDDTTPYMGTCVFGNYLISWGVYYYNEPKLYYRISDQDPFILVTSIYNAFIYDGTIAKGNKTRLCATFDYDGNDGLHLYDLEPSGPVYVTGDTSRSYRKARISNNFIACTSSNVNHIHVLTSWGTYLYTIEMVHEIKDIDLIENNNEALLVVGNINQFFILRLASNLSDVAQVFTRVTTDLSPAEINSVSINDQYIAIGIPKADRPPGTGYSEDLGIVYLFEYEPEPTLVYTEYTNSIDSTIQGFVIDAPSVRIESDQASTNLFEGALQVSNGGVSADHILANREKLLGNELAVNMSTGTLQIPSGGISSMNLYTNSLITPNANMSNAVVSGIATITTANIGTINATGTYCILSGRGGQHEKHPTIC